MIQYRGGNGSSKEKAVIVIAPNEKSSVDAEYEFIQCKYGDFELESQTFIAEEDEKYDILDIKLSDESNKEIVFEITDYFGKE